MKKLATILAATTIVATGAAFANDPTGSPTVPKNSLNNTEQSYSDHSTTAKGSNAPMNDKAAAQAETNGVHKHKKAKAKAKADTSLGTDATLSTDTSTASEQRMKSQADIGSGTTPAAPTPGSKAATVNDTQGKSGQ